jgi:ATPase subunit of ABC transporter with duplicated ATPase domains
VLSVELHRVSFAYSDSVPLISNLSLRLVPGWYGVVGPNGAGKSTLLRLLSGDLSPDGGEIRLHPPRLERRLCPQRAAEPGAEVGTFAVSSAGPAHRLRGRLALDPRDLDRWPTLSAGQRKRWQIGAALAAEPSLLLLDEPTNHLDEEARALLVEALRRYEGVGLVVSHDRTLLDGLTSWTLRFAGGEVRTYRGPYGRARETWQAEDRETLGRWETIRSEQKKLERRLADRRRSRASAEAGMSTRRRMKGPKDSDARGRFKAKRRRSAEVSLGREIGKVLGKLDRLADEASRFRFDKTLGRSLFVDYRPASVPTLLALQTPALRGGERLLLADVDVIVGRESRIWLRGPNGVGKSTLLRTLVSQAKIPAERLLYLPQELDPTEERALLDSVRGLPAEERGSVLSLVAALGVDPDPLLESGQPSPGEARKVSLAYGLARQVWGLVLDEPTNHLDLPSIERLEEMLGAYPGALLLVTHDDRLARRCTSVRWDLEGERIVLRTTETEGGEPG